MESTWQRPRSLLERVLITPAALDFTLILSLLLVMSLFVALVQPVRSFPITDDWIYAGSVRDLLNFAYKPHDWSQATALSHTAIGALFTAFLGFNFTVLSAANLLVASLTLAVFFVLLRELGASPQNALLGTAVMVFNPVFIYLSYSFMTDITFLLYLLTALLCYVRGFHRANTRWLVLGGCAVALAFLTRQFGVLLVVPALVYLWRSGTWTWVRAGAIAAVPLVCVVVYQLWLGSQPSPLVDLHVASFRALAVEHPQFFLWDRTQRLVWSLTVVGLCLAPVATFPRKIYWFMPVFIFMALFHLRSIVEEGTILPGEYGNVIDHSGFLMQYYGSAPVWNEATWAILGVIGAISLSAIAGYGLAELTSWLRGGHWRTPLRDPAFLVYAFASIILVVVLTVTHTIFDRYFLPIMAAAILLMVRRSTGPQAAPQLSPLDKLRWPLLAVLLLFSLASQHDYWEHSRVRWEQAENIALGGVARNKIEAGLEWSGWYLYDEGAEHVRKKSGYKFFPFPPDTVLDPVYLVSDKPKKGYHTIRTATYPSWLNGGSVRQVLTLKRNGTGQ